MKVNIHPKEWNATGYSHTKWDGFTRNAPTISHMHIHVEATRKGRFKNIGDSVS